MECRVATGGVLTGDALVTVVVSWSRRSSTQRWPPPPPNLQFHTDWPLVWCWASPRCGAAWPAVSATRALEHGHQRQFRQARPVPCVAPLQKVGEPAEVCKWSSASPWTAHRRQARAPTTTWTHFAICSKQANTHRLFAGVPAPNLCLQRAHGTLARYIDSGCLSTR
jgi:hypothetical protein